MVIEITCYDQGYLGAAVGTKLFIDE